MSKTKIVTIIVIIALYLYVGIAYMSSDSKNISETLSRYGSTGSEVRNIQTKLKNWGYYTGDIDGVYGSGTVTAVKYFQKANGLKIDGIAGKNTLAAMGISSQNSNSINGTADVELLARVIYGESRGEPYTGMVAVRCSNFK